MQSECTFSKTNGWWMIIIDICMAIFGAACAYSLSARQYNWNNMSVYLTPVLVCIVGIVALFIDMRRQPEENKPYALGPIINLYIQAWRKIRSQKWILWLFGSIAALNIISIIYSVVLTTIYAQQRFQDIPRYHLQDNWIMGIASSLLTSMNNAIPMFFSGTGIIYQGIIGIIFPLVALPILFVAYQSLKTTQDSNPLENKTLIKALLVVFAVACIAMFVDNSMQIIESWGFLKLITTPAHAASATTSGISYPHGSFGGRRHFPTIPPYSYVITIIVYTLVNAAFIGGVFASLTRCKSGGNITITTFRKDALHYLLPLTGIYFAAALFTYIPFIIKNSWYNAPNYINVLQFFVIPLIFAPIIAVAQNLNTMEAIKQNVQYWKKNTWQIIMFIAVGSFIIALLKFGINLTHLFIAKASWFRVPLNIIATLISTLSHAIIPIAIWEFYVNRTESLSETQYSTNKTGDS